MITPASKYKYDFAYTLWRAFVAALVTGGIPALLSWLSEATIPATPEELKAQLPYLVSGAAGALFYGMRNYWRNKDKGTTPYWPMFAAMIAGASILSLSGCGTLNSHVQTEFSETVTPDGGMETTFSAKSRGEVDASVHRYEGTYHPETGAHVAVGQESSGITSPAQQQLVQTLSVAIPAALQAAGQFVPGGGAGGAESDDPTGSRIDRLLDEIERLRERLDSVEAGR